MMDADEMYVREYLRRRSEVAAELYHLARRLEDGMPTDFINDAAWVVSKIHNMLPNLPLTALIKAAAEVESFRASNTDNQGA
jgi:hypothetical protein